MTDQVPPGTPVGWYPDSRGKPVYWNGAAWDFKAKPPTSAVTAGVTPPGWYPNGAKNQSYWDGRAWTGQHAPLVQKNPAAIASLVLALVAIVVALFGGLVGIVVAAILILLGLLFGLDGLSRARKRGGAGRGPATAGVILCSIPILILVLSQLRT